MYKWNKIRPFIMRSHGTWKRNRAVLLVVLIGMLGLASYLLPYFLNDISSANYAHDTSQQTKETTVTDDNIQDGTSKTQFSAEDASISANSSVIPSNNLKDDSQQAWKPNAVNPPYANPVVNPPSSFGIVLSPWATTNYEPYTMSIPYHIKRIAGHTAPINSMSGQVLSAEPGMSCIPSSRDPEYGEIVVHVTASTPHGQYTCQVTMSDGDMIRTKQFNFIVTSSLITTPY